MTTEAVHVPRQLLNLTRLDELDEWMKKNGYEWQVEWSGGEIGRGELVGRYREATNVLA